MEFGERTIRVIIDTALCHGCETHACVAACATYDRGILTLGADGLPTVTLSADDLLRRGTECLACEEACRLDGNAAIRIEAPIPGLAEYRAAHGT